MALSTNAICVWDMTLPFESADLECLKNAFKMHCKSWAFQEEMGDSGYHHWQCRFSLKVKSRHPRLGLPSGCRFSPTSEANKDNMFYVMDEETRVSGPYTDKDEEIYIPRQYRDITLRPFQKNILESAKDFDPRKIDLIYCPNGGSGKSTIASLAELLHGGFDCPPVNDSKELIQSVCCYLVDRQIREPKIMFFDMPRAMDKKFLNGMYSAIEQIKKGKVFDLRYHYKCWWFDSPRIWVFTNSLPDLNLLSNDRWRCWTINEFYELEHYSTNNLGAQVL